jgi:hypothetical protein
LAFNPSSVGTPSASVLADVSVAPTASPYAITKALHAGKRVLLSPTLNIEAVFDITGWSDGDTVQIVNDTPSFSISLRSTSYAALGPVENRALRGVGSTVTYVWNAATSKFKVKNSSFPMTSSNLGDLTTAAWIGDGTAGNTGRPGQMYYSGANMDAYFGNGTFLIQANNGGSTYINSPDILNIRLASTVYRVKPGAGAYPAYGQSSSSYMGLELSYYEGGVGSLMRFMQTNAHSVAANAQSIAPSIGANGLGERNWFVMAGPGGTIFSSPSGSGFNGEYGRITTNGNKVWARAVGYSSEQQDIGAGTHSMNVNDGISQLILSGSGALTIALPTISGEEVSRDICVSLTTPYTSIATSGGATAALGALPLTAGSFFMLRWSPLLAAWHRKG